MLTPPPNLIQHAGGVTRAEREARNGHRGAIVWLTGLSGSGKSTLAYRVEASLHELGLHSAVLDGDSMRLGLCSDLGFSLEDRHENIRRVAEAARLLLEQGCVVLVSLVSSVRRARDEARERVAEGDFLEVYCDCPLEVCRRRDPKGLYARAEQGLIAEFTGVSSPYEPPLAPELVLDTANRPLDAAAGQLLRLVLETCGQPAHPAPSRPR